MSKVSYEIAFIVCNYHVYKAILEVEIISELHCLSKADNCKDHHVEAIFQAFESSHHSFFSSLSSS